MRQLETSSRLFRDKDKRYKHNFHVAVSLNRHFCDKFANFGLILKIYRATVVRVSHDFPANVTYFHLNSYDARHSYECCLVLFSRQIVARFSQDCRATVLRHSRDIRTSVAKISHCKFAKISRRQVHDTRKNVARLSRDSLAKYFGEKIRIKFFNMLKNFATSSRHKKILTTLAGMSCESPATKFAKQSREIRMPVRY